MAITKASGNKKDRFLNIVCSIDTLQWNTIENILNTKKRNILSLKEYNSQLNLKS